MTLARNIFLLLRLYEAFVVVFFMMARLCYAKVHAAATHKIRSLD